MDQQIQHDPDQRPPKLRYIALIGATVLGIGVVFYHFIEGWTWLNSVYFCVITLTTVGYGDITPQTNAGKAFTTFYVLIGIGIFAAVINYLIRRGTINRITKFRAKHGRKD